MNNRYSRRGFLVFAGLVDLGLEAGVCENLGGKDCEVGELSYKGESIRLGLVTYQWGKDWDLPTLISNCEVCGFSGVELRTTHAHGVEPKLSPAERGEVRRRFEDSSIVCLGPGSDERYDHPDPSVLNAAKERTKEFIRLSHDIGGSGVKVKPNDFHKDIPREKTIEQIGKSLGEVAEYALGFGQELRLEVHGQCAELPTIAKIIEIADHPNAKVCWNSNRQDLDGGGLASNFGLVEESLGETVHVRELNREDYPYGKLMDLLVGIDYAGWVMIEASSKPKDLVLAMKGQREYFDAMLVSSRKRAT